MRKLLFAAVLMLIAGDRRRASAGSGTDPGAAGGANPSAAADGSPQALRGRN
jgi:hypothetical protein